MKGSIMENLLFILAGIIVLYIGLRWKNPNYGGGIVHKYTLIILGAMAFIYGLVTLF